MNTKKLLSLPPHVVDSFHRLTDLSPDEFFCTSDPADRKLGSGGGTTWLLEACHRSEAPDVDFPEWLRRERRILLHAGGQSRRLPAYAPSGKVLTPVPVFRWARGQRIDQTLLDLQLPLFEDIMSRAPRGFNTLIASGDVLLRREESLQDIPEGADVVCYGLWAEPRQASNHGVFFMNRQRSNELDFMLQKPSTDRQAALMPTHYSLMDIGLWLLSDRAVEALVRRSRGEDGGIAAYDLYSQFGCALGQNPSAPDAALAGLRVAILPLPGGEFYHYGTGEDMIASSVAVQNRVKDQRFIVQCGVKVHPSIFIQNATVATGPTVDNHNLWIENARLGEGWRFTARNIVTGIPQNGWRVTLRPGQCLDIAPVGDRAYVLRPYGFDDAFRGSVTDASTQYLGRSMKAWMERRGLEAEVLGRTDDLQAARLFPVSADMDVLERALHWFLDEEPDPAFTAEWEAMERLSADEISLHANLDRLFAQRRSLAIEALPVLAGNHCRSVFYQTNLKDMAGKFAGAHLPLPPEPLRDESLMTRIHDAMFRSEVLRIEGRGEASAEQSARAFSLLREGLTEGAREHRSLPRMTTLRDQIVWGRSPARIDVAGGWTDTPPYSLLFGGSVVNVAIELNGQPPMQVYVKPSEEPHIVCRSIDLGAREVIRSYEELRAYNRVGSPFSIPKAALALAGFLPDFCSESFATLEDQLRAFGGGLEITLLAAIPAGSGLGTSSILAATVLGALNDFCGLGWDKNEICGRTLVLEQLLTTGGGWQDQYGGVLHGVKWLQTAPGFDQSATARWLPDTLFTDPEMQACHLLYYTGLTRTAKNILTEIVRGMFLNNTRHLRLLGEMGRHAETIFEAIQLGDIERYGRLVRRTWEQNKALDAGTNPPLVEALCRRIDDLCWGYKLPGAGGGGYLYMVAKDPAAALRIREMLTAEPLAPGARFTQMSVSRTGMQISRS